MQNSVVRSLVHAVFNTVMLVAGTAVLMMTWRLVSDSNDSAFRMLMSSEDFGGPVLDILGMIWLGVRILFWLVVALGVTAIVLGVLAVTGVLAWFLKQMGVGVGYLASWVRNQYSSAVGSGGNNAASSVGTVVVGEDDDGPVTLVQCLRDFAQQLDDYETHIDEIIERIETLEKRNVQDPVI